MENQTEDTRDDDLGAELARLRFELSGAESMRSSTDDATRKIAAAHARATIELVEAVRDLTAIVVLAMQPPRLVMQEPPIVDESAAESGDEADEPEAPTTFGDVAPTLSVGDYVNVDGGGAFAVTSAGTTEGSAWIEVHDGKKAKRVFVDAVPPKLAARVVLSVEGDDA